jgi:hypothetical protein
MGCFSGGAQGAKSPIHCSKDSLPSSISLKAIVVVLMTFVKEARSKRLSGNTGSAPGKKLRWPKAYGPHISWAEPITATAPDALRCVTNSPTYSNALENIVLTSPSKVFEAGAPFPCCRK